MMVTDIRCWWQNQHVDDFFRYVGDFLNEFGRQDLESVTNISNLSPTNFVSNIRHQHRCNLYKNLDELLN